MPGLVGFAGSPPHESPRDSLARMAHALEPDGRFTCDQYCEPALGMARLHLGIVNGESQPIWNERQTICVMMEGELFDYADLQRDLTDRGHVLAVGSDAEFLLHLYEEYGDQCASRLNGAFVAVIWDRTSHRLVLINDRFGLHPVYYTQPNGRFLFSSGLRALLAAPDLRRHVDVLSLAQFLTLDHLVGNRTLLADVFLLPPATILTYHDGRLNLRTYWRCRYNPRHSPSGLNDYVDQANYHLQQAVKRSLKGEASVGLYLSGGLDSRALLACLADQANGTRLHTFTWGIPNCRDARFAREIANKAGVRNTFVELRPDWLLHLAEEGVRITDGLGNIVNFHALAPLSEVAAHAKIIYKGFFGDALMGYYDFREFLGIYDIDTVTRMLFDRYTITFGPEEQQELLAPEYYLPAKGLVYDACRAALAEADTELAYDQLYHFDLCHRQRRMTLNGVQLVRSRAVARIPFCDNDLVDFMLSMPPGLRFDRHLAKAAFIRAHAPLATIPFTGSGLPLIDCFRDVKTRFGKVVSWHLSQRSLGGQSGPGNVSYANYPVWMRNELRRWVEETLLDTRTLERGYFVPGYVRRLVSEHLAGRNHAVKLGALISLKLWHRQFMD